ncbi:methylated-DNA--[protein]-cysteine S-methyltransferase [Orbus mooreae]|uniref:methylated-DNA--[protein]-cysteine S-methyltransferase n=1 Tax=Orbus mooreae TaxID=3074107 RepID=UPI00370D933E
MKSISENIDNKYTNGDQRSYIGSRQTGIFCRDICSERESISENIEHFASTYDAILSGYTACKICQPLYVSEQTPDQIVELLSWEDDYQNKPLSDDDLRERGLDAKIVDNWFLTHHNMTFSIYQRMNRMMLAMKALNNAHFDVNTYGGMTLLVHFGDLYQMIFSDISEKPKGPKGNNIVCFSYLDLSIGSMFIAATEKGVCLLEFSDRLKPMSEFKTFINRYNATLEYRENIYIEQAKRQLNEYLDGKRKTFTIPLDIKGTPFQTESWMSLMVIAYGTTSSYLDLANYMATPKAIRAVGKINGMNPVSIIIPCHRAIGTTGKLVGYSGGLSRKDSLLNLEQKNKNNPFPY